jgi:ribonuclease R
MQRHIGDVAEGTVTAVTGGGLYVTLDEPFVDVLVRYESLGPDRYRIDDDELGVTGERSGDKVYLGDRITVSIEDVALQRRSVLARRIVPERMLSSLDREHAPPAERGRRKVRDRQPADREAQGRVKPKSGRPAHGAKVNRKREAPAHDDGERGGRRKRRR